MVRAYKEPPSTDPDDLDVLQIQVRDLGTLRFETATADAAAAAMLPSSKFL